MFREIAGKTIGVVGRGMLYFLIEDMRNPHDPKTGRSLAILKINRMAPEDLMEEISGEIKAHAAFSIKL